MASASRGAQQHGQVAVDGAGGRPDRGHPEPGGEARRRLSSPRMPGGRRTTGGWRLSSSMSLDSFPSPAEVAAGVADLIERVATRSNAGVVEFLTLATRRPGTPPAADLWWVVLGRHQPGKVGAPLPGHGPGAMLLNDRLAVARRTTHQPRASEEGSWISSYLWSCPTPDRPRRIHRKGDRPRYR